MNAEPKKLVLGGAGVVMVPGWCGRCSQQHYPQATEDQSCNSGSLAGQIHLLNP